jgi:biopolymer transport protein ExbD
MIDVTFLLLVFFILTFTFRPAEGEIPSALPSPDDDGRDVIGLLCEPIEVRVLPAGPQGADAIYEMRGAAGVITTPHELHNQLLARRQLLGGQADVVIRPTRDVRWQHAVEAFNQAVRARFKTVTFKRLD